MKTRTPRPTNRDPRLAGADHEVGDDDRGATVVVGNHHTTRSSVNKGA